MIKYCNVCECFAYACGDSFCKHGDAPDNSWLYYPWTIPSWCPKE